MGKWSYLEWSVYAWLSYYNVKLSSQILLSLVLSYTGDGEELLAHVIANLNLPTVLFC